VQSNFASPIEVEALAEEVGKQEDQWDERDRRNGMRLDELRVMAGNQDREEPRQAQRRADALQVVQPVKEAQDTLSPLQLAGVARVESELDVENRPGSTRASMQPLARIPST
jgi:hypothetical protein